MEKPGAHSDILVTFGRDNFFVPGGGNSFYLRLFYVTLLIFQAPGTPIIARQVTPTTIIKQVSQAQTTVQPSATLQRSPGVQVRGRAADLLRLQGP